MFKPTNLNLNFSIIEADSAVEVFPELVKCATKNSDRAVGKMPLTFLILQTEELTKESHQHTPPPPKKNRKTKKAKKEAKNECTFLRPN